MPSPWQNLAENAGILVILLIVMGGITWFAVRLGIRQILNEIADIWTEIGKIREKQSALRETLPIDYVRQSGLDKIETKIDRMSEHIESFMNDCHKEECPLGKRMKEAAKG